MTVQFIFDRGRPVYSQNRLSVAAIDREATRITEIVLTCLHACFVTLCSELTPEAHIIVNLAGDIERYNSIKAKMVELHGEAQGVLCCLTPVVTATVGGIYIPLSGVAWFFSMVGSAYAGFFLSLGIFDALESCISSSELERMFIGDKRGVFDSAAQFLSSKMCHSTPPSPRYSHYLQNIVSLANVILKSCSCLSCFEDFCDRTFTHGFVRETMFKKGAEFAGFDGHEQQYWTKIFIQEKITEVFLDQEARLKNRREIIDEVTKFPDVLLDICCSYLCSNTRAVNSNQRFYNKVRNYLREVNGYERDKTPSEDPYSRPKMGDEEDYRIWINEE